MMTIFAIAPTPPPQYDIQNAVVATHIVHSTAGEQVPGN